MLGARLVVQIKRSGSTHSNKFKIQHHFTTMSANRDDPRGLFIDTSQKYQISTVLGHGACGSVHALVKRKKDASTISVPYVVKVAPMPKTSNSNKKRKKTLVEKNADLLNHENVLYRNVLNELRGTMVPDVPVAGSRKGESNLCANLPGFGDIDGYRFLVMERMDAPFPFLVHTLYHEALTKRNKKRGSGSRSSSAANSAKELSIPIGPIASRLLSLMEAIHETKHVFVDVKPDNFMLVGGNIQHQSSNIRMIDFGLVESYRDVMRNKHRQDQYPNGQVVGTPTYLSLNVLNGHTVSRRDDLEAVGYVLLELILQLRNFSGEIDEEVQQDLLPWSRAKSDEEIRDQKECAVQGSDGGVFWNDMIGCEGRDHKVRDVMKEFMNIVGALQFKEQPDYDGLRTLLSTLKVKVSLDLSRGVSSASGTATKASPKRRKTVRDKKVASKKSAATSTRTSNIRSTVTSAYKSDDSSGSIDDDDANSVDSEVVVPSTKLSARAARAAARNAAKSSQEEQVGIIELQESDDDEDDVEMIYEEDEESATNDRMDWELIADENESSVSNKAAKSSAMTTARARATDQQGKAINKKKSILKADEDDNGGDKKQGPPSLRLVCTEGPHKGEEIMLVGTLILGQSPKQRGRSEIQLHALPEDLEASASHAKLELKRSGKVMMVRVHDLKSTSGTMINQKFLPNGGSRQAFVKDTVKIGNSSFTILKH